MSALTDIQDNIEKLRSLQESLHDLCTFISTLDLTPGAKEDTLINGIAELKEAFANIDLSSLETTLVSGLNEVKDAVSNIDFTDLENSIGEVKDAVANIDFSTLAKEDTLTTSVQSIIDAINAIEIPTTDLTPVAKESTLTSAKEEILTAVENAKVDIDTTELAKEVTLNAVSNKLDNLNVEVDLSGVESGLQEVKQAVENIELPEIDTSAIAKQGENAEATNTAILAEIKAINDLKNIYSVRFEQNQDGDNTYTMVLPLVAGIVGDTIIM